MDRTPPESPRAVARSLAVIDFVLLLVLLAALGRLLVGAHWSSNWADPEFTGWVAPVANRVAEGQILYADGGHSPLPPLSVLMVFAVTFGGASWHTESLLGFLFQAGTIVLLYGLLRATAGRVVAILAAVCGSLVFFAIPKTILYDPMCQFGVAATLVATAGWLRSSPSRRSLAWLAVAGLLGATTVLVKQSTGGGLCLAVAALAIGWPPGRSWRDRLVQLGVLLAGAGVGLAAWLAILAPWVSLRGMLVDVFLTGSEPKGGTLPLLHNLMGCSQSLIAHLGVGTGLVWAAWWHAGRYVADRAARCRIVLGGLMVLQGIGLLYVFGQYWDRGFLSPLDDEILAAPLWLGLAALLLRRIVPYRAADWPVELTLLAIPALAAAMFHSLSVDVFRWTYDNNPLIVLALGGYWLAVVQVAHSAPSRMGRVGLRAAALIVTLAGCWVGFLPVGESAAACHVAWPEVEHLRMARLRPEAAGMRSLVAEVRGRAPRANDTVLLLPNDPGVEAWFSRPRPQLACSILFTDQYWDRYVDDDFARIARDPPQVIVVGPRDFWRPFARCWHKDCGAERLIDRVQRELLPRSYELAVSVPIRVRTKTDHMDVFVRRDPPLLTGAGNRP